MPSYVVAIDNGSQSTKVSIVDERGAIHSSARVRLAPTEYPAPGRVVHPGDDVWESICRACRLAFERFTGDRHCIVGVGLCTIRFCRALLNSDGSLAQPLLSWMDERVGRPHIDDPPVSWVTASSGYVTHRLTGRHGDTAANYQGQWPFDQATWRWSTDPAAYARSGVRPDQLFELVDPGESLGTITAQAAAATCLPEGVPVFATANDKAVEALGAGLVSRDDVVISLGTYISAMTLVDTAGDGDRYWVNCGCIPRQYLAESEGIRRGMWTVSWFRGLVDCSGSGGSGEYDMESVLDAEAAEIAPGSDGIRAVLDWLAPPEHPSRRGALIGFSGAQTRAHIYRALLEGIAFTMSDAIASMADELGRDFHRIIVTGGGASSQILPGLFADLLGVPVLRTEVGDAAGTGAAICAAVGSGLHSGWDQAARAMVRWREPVLPSESAAEYTRLRKEHRRVRQMVRHLSAALN